MVDRQMDRRLLAIAVNLGFIAFLVFSVTWQNRKETPVSVELYAPACAGAESRDAQAARAGTTAARTARTAQARAPEPPKPPPEASRSQPPEPPKPIPKVEPPAPSKAEIALKAKQEQAERARIEKEKRDAEKREADKREAEKKKQEDKRLADARERQAREADALKAQAERERIATAKAAEATQAKAMDEYIRRIQARIKGNVVLPPDMVGQSGSGIRRPAAAHRGNHRRAARKSSGVRAYDEAVQRAIIKASPLPKPDVADLFRRNLTLKFRPSD